MENEIKPTRWYTVSELHKNGMVMGYRRDKILELIRMGFLKAKKGPADNSKYMVSDEEVQRFINSPYYEA